MLRAISLPKAGDILLLLFALQSCALTKYCLGCPAFGLGVDSGSRLRQIKIHSLVILLYRVSTIELLTLRAILTKIILLRLRSIYLLITQAIVSYRDIIGRKSCLLNCLNTLIVLRAIGRQYFLSGLIIIPRVFCHFLIVLGPISVYFLLINSILLNAYLIKILGIYDRNTLILAHLLGKVIFQILILPFLILPFLLAPHLNLPSPLLSLSRLQAASATPALHRCPPLLHTLRRPLHSLSLAPGPNINQRTVSLSGSRAAAASGAHRAAFEGFGAFGGSGIILSWILSVNTVDVD